MLSSNSDQTLKKGYMSRILAIVPTARTSKSLQFRRSKCHSMEDARKSVADKLLANRNFLLDPSSHEKPDAVYREHSHDVYSLSVKYGNRWLVGMFDGETYLVGLTKAQVCDLLEAFAQHALAGEFDEYIKPIMTANQNARSKR